MIRNRLATSLVAATLVITAAACGDDEEPDASTPDATDTTEASDETSAPDETDAPSDSTGPDATEAPAATDTTASGDGTRDAALEELVAAAQEEGSLVWYSVPAEAIASAVSDGFSEEFGIDVEFQRLASSDLSQRYAAEADAGATVADAVFMSNTPFVPEALANGWTTPLADAGIPGFPGDYPEDFLLPDRGTAIASIEPSGIAFNTDMVDAADAPTTWADLADPKWDDQILLVDPAGSPAYIDFWSVVLAGEGPEVLEGIAANAAQTYPSGVPAVEALSAGEGSIVVPGVGAIAAGAAERGAPVDFVMPDLTTGPELVVLVSAEAPHPNAARLFAWYLLFGEGHEIANALPSTASPRTGEDMPANYTRVAPDAQSLKDQILGLLSLD